MRISFVFPMFNEIGNIERVIRSTHEVACRTLDGLRIGGISGLVDVTVSYPTFWEHETARFLQTPPFLR